MIAKFFKCKQFVVVGASADRTKFGNKVLRKYIEKELTVTPVHPKLEEIEGKKVKQLKDIAAAFPTEVDQIGISIITPPQVTTSVVKEAAELGFKHIWIQPDAESIEAMDIGKEKGLNMIYGGPCVLVSLDKNEHLKGRPPKL